MISRTDLIELATKEFATTIKVISAFPEKELSFKPHERSSDARKLMSVFVFEMYLLKSYVLGETVDNSAYKDYNPEHLKEILDDFQKEAGNILNGMNLMIDENMTKEIDFAGKKYTASSFILMMIKDQIHHRGQLSVYVRMAGGKVPAIYGPSADDNGTNL
jgi:DinB family protein